LGNKAKGADIPTLAKALSVLDQKY